VQNCLGEKEEYKALSERHRLTEDVQRTNKISIQRHPDGLVEVSEVGATQISGLLPDAKPWHFVVMAELSQGMYGVYHTV